MLGEKAAIFSGVILWRLTIKASQPAVVATISSTVSTGPYFSVIPCFSAGTEAQSGFPMAPSAIAIVTSLIKPPESGFY